MGTETRPKRRPSRRRWLVALLGAALAAGALAGGAVMARARAAARDARSARAAVAARRCDEARGPLGRWLRARPRSGAAHALKAELALAGGDLAEVSRALNTARALGCPAAELDRVHALVLTRLGRFGEAEPILVRRRAESD